MMYVQLVALATLVICFVVDAQTGLPYKVCVNNVTACNNAGLNINVTCQAATSGSSCVEDVANGRANMTLASADHMVQNADNLQIVIGQKLPNLDNFIQDYGLAVVKKNTTFNFTSLRNQKSCHTGVRKTVGWKIPVGSMIFNKMMPFTENQYVSASNFFSQSCAPGARTIQGINETVKNDLCSLCNGTCAQNSTEAYYNYEGAFKCMADGNNDRVGFVKETTATEFLNKSLNYGVLGDYKLLCPDGTTAALDQYKNCYIGTRPLYAIVTGKSTSSETITRIQNMLEGVTDLNKLMSAGIVTNNIERLVRYTGGSVKDYVGSYGNYYNGLSGRTAFFTACVSDVSACRKAGLTNVTCVGATPGSTCAKDVADGRAHMTLATADSMVQYADNLQIVYGQKRRNLDNFIQYYGLAVVKKNTSFNFTSLQNQKSCHTGVRKTVGWKIPVGYLLYNREMMFTNNQYESASNFFGQSCAPGINDIEGISDAVKTDLCSLCNGTCAQNSTEPYYNYEGAFKCMADGDNDRVGFVRQTTAMEFLLKYPSYGNTSDYELLCPDGTKAALDQYKNCHIGTRPLYAIVTGKSKSSATIKLIRNMLNGTDLNKLEAAGIVTNNIERLVRYTGGSVREYVGSYGNYYNGLIGSQKGFYKVCVNDVSACGNASLPNVTCVATRYGSSCVKDVIDGQAHMTLAAADWMVQNAENLQIIYGQKLPNLDNFIQYYGLAVVKKYTTFNFTSLRNQKSCHTGVGKTVGWKIPVGSMIFTTMMPYMTNQYMSASSFFSQSCAPGAKTIQGINETVKNDLCSLCNGTCAQNSTEAYYNYEGAFKCMADGNNDRVGFVRQTTAMEFLAKYPSYGAVGDYKLLCPDGTTAAMNQYKNCYIGTRPLYAIVTGKSTTSATITLIQNMLNGTDLNKLMSAGIVTNNIERLVRYTGGSVKDYVGSYGNYFDALSGRTAFFTACVSDVSACRKVGLTNVTCAGATPGSTCAKDVADGRAHMTLAAADSMVQYADNLQIVYGQKLPNLDNFIQYYGLAVVKKDTTFNFTSLRNQKSCHTGVGKTVGWKIPVGSMIFTKMMPYMTNQYVSASDFFSQSCAPGINDIPGVSDAVKRDLCSLCNGTCAQNSTEAYYNYEGAFKCMADGENDRVGFVRQTTAMEFLAKYPSYGAVGDYKLLCPDGTTAALNQYKNCYIGTRPLYAIVTGKSTSSATITLIRNMLNGTDLNKLQAAGVVTNNIERLVRYTGGSVKDYVGSYGNYYNGLSGRTASFTACVSDVSACRKARLTNVACAGATPGSTCAKDVADGRAHMTLAAADSMVQYGDNLQIVYGQKLPNLDNFIQYYGLAVVQKDAPFNFRTLMGKKSCHTGVGKTVGWKIPVGNMLYNRTMRYTTNQYVSAASFFSESCAPGAKTMTTDVISEAVKNDLCSLCNGTCAQNSTEPYYDYMGAFKCMADGNNDRVGFVRQTTAMEFLAKYPNYRGTTMADYKLLCQNGTTAALTQYKSCNLGTRPLYAIVTGKSTTSATITQMRNMLNGAELNKFKAAGIVTNNADLVLYTGGSVKEYVGSYGYYYNGLRGVIKGAAPSFTMSLTLQIAAILVFWLMA